jgi:predicted N-acetyltransferase YhbS
MAEYRQDSLRTGEMARAAFNGCELVNDFSKMRTYTDHMWEIRSEQANDEPAIDALVDRCFGPGRYAKTAYRLREGVEAEPRLSFVAVSASDGVLLGSVRFWPIMVGSHASLLLGPLAVEPELRGRGIGISLMQRGIDHARTLGFETIILVGDEPYYARVGFSKLAPGRVRMPGPVDASRLLGLSLKHDALVSLSGDVRRARIDNPVSAQTTPLG